MIKYEYKILVLPSEKFEVTTKALNEAGIEGWQLKAVDGNKFYMQRELVEVVKEPEPQPAPTPEKEKKTKK